MNRATRKHGLQVRTRCGVKPEAAALNPTIRKFRTVARDGAWTLESLSAQHKAQLASKNKKGKIMSQHEVNNIAGRLSLRPPQSEPLAKLANAIDASKRLVDYLSFELASRERN